MIYNVMCVLPGPEQVCPNHGRNDLSFYVRRWWPSKYEIGHLEEIYVTDLSLETTLNKVLILLFPSRGFSVAARRRLDEACANV